LAPAPGHRTVDWTHWTGPDLTVVRYGRRRERWRCVVRVARGLATGCCLLKFKHLDSDVSCRCCGRATRDVGERHVASRVSGRVHRVDGVARAPAPSFAHEIFYCIASSAPACLVVLRRKPPLASRDVCLGVVRCAHSAMVLTRSPVAGLLCRSHFCTCSVLVLVSVERAVAAPVLSAV
jgi:hypothetical protein